jgi:hypothetical protein
MGLEYLIFDARGDYRDILSTPRTFVNRKLASLYNVRAPVREGFGELILAEDDPRRGLLGQVSFLALNAHPTSSSATLRGIFVRQKLLCDSIPSPPSNVDTSIPEPSGEAPTLRDRIREHSDNLLCSNCHAFMDPIGLGLENFDGIGRFRAADNGAAIDASGSLDGERFEGPLTLYEAIKSSPRFGVCLTQKLYQHVTGREVAADDRPMVEALAMHFAAAEYDVLTLMFDVATSPRFRDVSEPSLQGGE